MISIKCDQSKMGIPLTNQVTELMKVQYLQNELKLIFYMHRCLKKQPFDSNIYNGSAKTWSDTFKSINKVLSK